MSTAIVVVGSVVTDTHQRRLSVRRDREQNVFNLTSSSEFKVTWAKIIEVLREVNQVIPFNNVVWYPGGSLKTNRMVHLVCLLLFQLIPAYFIDSLIYLAGYKPV